MAIARPTNASAIVMAMASHEGRPMRPKFSLLQALNEAKKAPEAADDYRDSDEDKSGTEPERRAIRTVGRIGKADRQRLQEQAETGDDEA